MELAPNPGKNLIIEVGDFQYARLPIKTHVIGENDQIEAVVEKYTKPYNY